MSMPPSSSPTAPPAAPSALKIPKALAPSDGSVKVTQSSESSAGASTAAKRPWVTRAATKISKLQAEPPRTDAAPKPAKPDHEEGASAQQVTKAAAEQQQAAERQRVTRDDPLPVAVAEAEVFAAPREARCSRRSHRA